MHKYIDESKIKQFNRNITVNDVIDDIEKYGITGFYSFDTDADLKVPEAKYYIADALYSDYIQKRANYEAYIEEGMTARMLMTLRLSSLFDFDEDTNLKFWREHRSIDTPEEAIALRIEYGRWHLHPQYSNFDYQNLYALIVMWGNGSNDIVLDYEPYFSDRKYAHTKSRLQIRDEWIQAIAHLPPIVDGRLQWKGSVPDEFYKYRLRVVDTDGTEIDESRMIESSGN